MTFQLYSASYQKINLNRKFKFFIALKGSDIGHNKKVHK